MPPREGIDTSALQEAFRRRANLGPASTAGIPPGVANQAPQATTPQQVLAERTLPSQAPQPPQMASQGGIQQLGKSAPGEAEIIIRALIQRLRRLGGTEGVA